MVAKSETEVEIENKIGTGAKSGIQRLESELLLGTEFRRHVSVALIQLERIKVGNLHDSKTKSDPRTVHRPLCTCALTMQRHGLSNPCLFLVTRGIHVTVATITVCRIRKRWERRAAPPRRGEGAAGILAQAARPVADPRRALPHICRDTCCAAARRTPHAERKGFLLLPNGLLRAVIIDIAPRRARTRRQTLITLPGIRKIKERGFLRRPRAPATNAAFSLRLAKGSIAHKV
ncbi:hypothetical protein EVAR_83240_1 [Eumeta japonica]|uniref:Uncharacterized protein n=1 Tax=Eumeta variegata TaxID=151549 RepID=A0A4C1Y520_EUMVA|nr:hypothetical protein EVAR_83240_1 [Eumeta japonica]